MFLPLCKSGARMSLICVCTGVSLPSRYYDPMCLPQHTIHRLANSQTRVAGPKLLYVVLKLRAQSLLPLFRHHKSNEATVKRNLVAFRNKRFSAIVVRLELRVADPELTDQI